MDNRQEIEELKAQSRWSGKRVVLLYWMAIMFLGTGFAIGLGTGVFNPKYTVESQFDHSSQTCETVYCHSDVVAEWGVTEHNTTVMYNSTHVAVGGSTTTLREFGAFNMTCAHCMTTRWVNGTAGTGADVEYWNLGIACGSCHEPGVANHTAENCGQCHTDNHWTYGEWNASAHADTLSNFATRSNPSSCLKCLVGQASFQVNFNTTGWPTSDPDWVDITCSACHDPHNNTNPGQLRVSDSTTLCGTCHGSTYSSHHQTNDTFFSGRQPHSDAECLDCHGYQLVFSHGAWEVHINHTWVIDDTGDACIVEGCHNYTGAEQLLAAEEIMNYTKDLTAEWTAEWAAANTTYTTALGTANADANVLAFVDEMLAESEHLAHLVDYDHSYGFHNPGLAEGRLTAAIELAHMAKLLAQEAIDNAAAPVTEYVTTTVYETTTVTVSPGFLLLPTLALLGVAALLIRKRRR